MGPKNQATINQAGWEINPDTLWKETDGSQLMDSKLKCVFVMPDILSGGSDTVANGTEKSSNDKPDSHHSIPTSVPTKSSSPKVSYSDGSGEDKSSDTLKRSVDEIR